VTFKEEYRMSEPFLGEVKIAAFDYPPKGWAYCNGQLLPINQNQALYALLGTQFGGNGQTNFALPNLQGRTPIHTGNGHNQGEAAGETSHTLIISEMPQHTHPLNASNTSTGGGIVPGNDKLMGNAGTPLYNSPQGLVAMLPQCVTSVGGSQAHNNMMPYLVLNFIVALQGIFPSPN
jgi:microcystin-dependent protein